MCYAKTSISTVDKLEKKFSTKLFKEKDRPYFDTPRYYIHGFKHEQNLIIPQQSPKHLIKATWGIVPENKSLAAIKSYYKESVKWGSGLNAQSEKLLSHWLYKNIALSKRCIIPINGFFEPHKNKNIIPSSIPIYIDRKDDAPFGLAGLYTQIKNTITYTILTTKAKSLFLEIHNDKKRMPVILAPNQYQSWLSSATSTQELMQIISDPIDFSNFKGASISREVYLKSNQHFDASIIAPFPYNDKVLKW